MKVVIDTNVFISGIFFTGPPYTILKLWHSGEIQIILTPEILDEFQRVGEVLKEDHPSIDLHPIIGYLIKTAEIINTPELPQPVSDDPDDDKFIAAAIACNCSIIISGDKHLLKISGFRGIKVLKPREFLDKYF